MRATASILLFSLLAITHAKASTTISTSSVSGHWTTAGSPYLIQNDINVFSGDALVIDPGVEIIFEGNYGLTVAGTLTAAGTAAMPINFHASDTTGWYDATTTTGGWLGITFGQWGMPSSWTSTFQYCNVSDMKSGGINAYYTNMILQNCNFFHNNASPIGGAIDTLHTFEIANCTLHNNLQYVFNMYAVGNGKAYIHDNKIYDNTSRQSTVFLINTDLRFTGNNVYNNFTYGPSSFESAIHIVGGTGIIKHNTIHDNTSQFDAALLCIGGVFDINANFICNNMHTVWAFCGAVDGGGGIHVSSNGAAPGDKVFFNIRNNVIANNFSPFVGGGIKAFWCDLSITNNQIVNNIGRASGGIHLTLDTFSAYIKNNMLYNNKTTALMITANVYIDLAKSITYEHNWTQNACSNEFFGATGLYSLLGDTTTNVIGTDPMMINPTATADVSVSALSYNFGLMPGSPCIDHGDTSGAMPDSFDYAGYPRIYGTSIDIGAYEYSPAAHAHTGVSSTPIQRITIEVFPNPATSKVYISTDEAEGSLIITDINGKTVAAEEVKNTITYIDIQALTSGIYFATWYDAKGNKEVQTIVKK